MNLGRRRTPRYQFMANAEILEIASGTTRAVKTGDLSIGGCFLNTANPPLQDAKIQVTIYHANRCFTASGRVVFVFPKLGMGVAFTEVRGDQMPILESWLAELDHKRGAGTASGRSGNDGEL
jgi:hypothetical protein